MKTAEFNENFEIDRRSKGVKAMPKTASAESAVAKTSTTSDGTAYDPDTIYHFFDEASREVRTSTGFRRTGDHLCAFGLKIVEVAQLHRNRDAALSDGQAFFNAQIEILRERIRRYEAEKQPSNRSLKAVLTSR